MKCPKCKVEMLEGEEGSLFSMYGYRVCHNPKCEYFGIKRIKIYEEKTIKDLLKNPNKLKAERQKA